MDGTNNEVDILVNPAIEVRQLGVADLALARWTFRVMAEVFDEDGSLLSEAYVASLLERGDFWTFAALRNGEPIGGVTAHVLPMTRSESRELFIYDLAVHPAHQRRGVGRALVSRLRTAAASAGIPVVFVPADEEDAHALAFYRALGGSAAPVSIFTFE